MWDTEYDYHPADDFKGTNLPVRCYESHPMLKLGKGELYGGSASHPMVKNADIYVSLQAGSTSGLSSDPWEDQKVVEVHYTITDMQAPADVVRFRKLVTWLCTQLQKGKSIHVGCIGGHGRTGTVIAAVVAELLKKKDAIQWVREHYCEKAVESKAQVQFLMKQYGVSEAKPAKEYTTTVTVKAEPEEWVESWRETVPKSKKQKVVNIEGVTPRTKVYEPMVTGRSLWRLKSKKVS